MNSTLQNYVGQRIVEQIKCFHIQMAPKGRQFMISEPQV